MRLNPRDPFAIASPARLALLVIACGGLIALASPAPQSQLAAAPLDSLAGSPAGTQRAYLPTINRALPPPTATPTPTTCPSLPGQSYGAISVESWGGTTTNASTHPDINLTVRGWEVTTSEQKKLVDYGYAGSDQRAPQLTGLFDANRPPAFTTLYRVYDWNWSTNARGPLISTWPVTLVGLASTPGEAIHVPPADYDIGLSIDGYQVLVLYATPERITLKYTREDNIIRGYAIHLEGICVDPNLVALYRSLDARGRNPLPALNARQPFATARGAEVMVAIRDTGSFMDPRSRLDWWHGY